MWIVPVWRPEIWRRVLGTTNHYVSTRGRVKCTVFRGKKRTWYIKLTRMKTQKRAYMAFRLNGKLVKVHVIMMKTFFPHSKAKWDNVDHIDGNGCNNDISNLRWCTHRFNVTNRTSKPLPRYGKWYTQYLNAVDGNKYASFESKVEAAVWLQNKKIKRLQKMRENGHAFEPNLIDFYRENLKKFIDKKYSKTFREL